MSLIALASFQDQTASEDGYLKTTAPTRDPFTLAKTASTCPKIWGFRVTEESVTIGNASATSDYGNFTDGSSVDHLVLKFCHYNNMTCTGAVADNYVSPSTFDPCKQQQFMNCKSPYKAQPANTVGFYFNHCLESGLYESDQYCGAQCPDITPTVDNGTVSQDSEGIWHVTCNPGHVLNGTVSSECQRNGSWSHDFNTTTCTYLKCNSSALPRGGNRAKGVPDGSKDPYAYGHNVSFACRRPGRERCDYYPDYVLTHNTTCLANESWSYIPKCLVGGNIQGWLRSHPLHAHWGSRGGVISLPIYRALRGTARAGINTTELVCTDTVVYTCNEHHEISNKDSLTLTCRSNGTWDREPPECHIVYCDNPTINITDGEAMIHYPNGTITQDPPPLFLANFTIHYECDPTFGLLGDERITCQENGTWNGTSVASCKLVTCPVPPVNIEHGHRNDTLVDHTSFHLGDQVEYECEEVCESGICNDDYTLNYTGPISCVEDGTWAPCLPTCDLVECSPPPVVNHSIPPAGPFTVHTRLSYKCERGYRISGSHQLKCGFKDGILGWQYNGKLPTCDIIPCSAPPTNIPHGTYLNTTTSYLYGATLAFNCSIGYNSTRHPYPSTNNYTTHCSEDEKWHPKPECSAVHCLQPGIAYSIVNDTRSLIPYGVWVEVRCDTIRQPLEQNIQCGQDGDWKPQIGHTLISCHGMVIEQPDLF
eukprot:sb/3462574/